MIIKGIIRVKENFGVVSPDSSITNTVLFSSMINNTKFFPIFIIIVCAITFTVEARHHRMVVPEDSKEWIIGSRAYMSGDYRRALEYIRPLA